MFEGFSQKTIDFMWSIRLNNNKVWFDANKDDYLRNFYDPMKALAQSVCELIATDHPDYGFFPKTARIYRDARRVRDGKPYRDLLWFTLENPNGGAGTVLWFELNPEHWYYAFGYFAGSGGMAKLQARIDKNPKAFEKMIAFLDKQTEFALEGDEYARKKEAPTPKTAAWYNKKHIILMHRQENDEALFSPELAKRLADGYKSLLPIYDYFASLDSDPVPNSGDQCEAIKAMK